MYFIQFSSFFEFWMKYMTISIKTWKGHVFQWNNFIQFLIFFEILEFETQKIRVWRDTVLIWVEFKFWVQTRIELNRKYSKYFEFFWVSNFWVELCICLHWMKLYDFRFKGAQGLVYNKIQFQAILAVIVKVKT